MTQNRRFLESLETRVLLTGVDEIQLNLPEHGGGAEMAPQFTVHQPPRIQPGNIPLIGTPAFDGLDRIDLIWQTLTSGDGTDDSFSAEIRKKGTDVWIRATDFQDPIDTGIGRFMHSVTIRGLDWQTDYEYRVHHLRGGKIVQTFQNQFRTRLPAGDQTAFSFAAYGDSTSKGRIENFNSVQAQINRHDVDFAVLLGDNFYTFGTHPDADGRLTTAFSPEAVDWTSRKVDYFGIGNHDIFVENGKASHDLYSVPVPIEGVTSPVGLPAGEFPEHSFSFDYGDVHFVTFDTNPVEFSKDEERVERLDALIDFAAADLEASDAQWKIVYGHHPFIGTEKRQLPDDFYFQKMVTRLNEAGADLVMLAHSHTFSWTYPLTGFEDADQNGIVTYDEIKYLRDEDQSYQKGDGIIQLVSGAGGGSLRHPDYGEPIFAQSFSLSDLTAPLEYGFARIDVNPQTLTVSYISAATGEIVGDLNADGKRDPDETFFGKFEIVDPDAPSPDVNSDGLLDSLDIDTLAAAIRNQRFDPNYDLNQDLEVTKEDLSVLLTNYFGVTPGDANLDGRFDSTDLVFVFITGEFEDDIEGNSGWADGDWNGDGEFSTRDLVIAFQEGQYASAAVSSVNFKIQDDAHGVTSNNAVEKDNREFELDAVYTNIKPDIESVDAQQPMFSGCGTCGTACFMNCKVCSTPRKSSDYRPQ